MLVPEINNLVFVHDLVREALPTWTDYFLHFSGWPRQALNPRADFAKVVLSCGAPSGPIITIK
jgi:hypothetical protein